MAIQKTLLNNPQKDDSKKNTTEAYYKRLIENMGKQIGSGLLFPQSVDTN